MTPLDALLMPWNVMEAATPLALWLMAEGILHEDATLALCYPVIWASGVCPFVSRSQNRWIDVAIRVRACVYLILGRRIP